MTMDHLDMEPDEPTALAVVPPVSQNFVPADFPLATLLQFLPDVKAKQRAIQLAEVALAVDVAEPNGLADADRAVANLRQCVLDITNAFKEPTDLANQLHKRLTKLRADFIDRAEYAAKTVGARIYAETRRRQAIVEEERRKAQLAADAQARAAAEAIAKTARERSAPADVVEALQQQAALATAPPVVSPIAAPVLGHSSTIEKWKARLSGTVVGGDPNPDMADLSADQHLAARQFFAAVASGEVPISYAAINWSALNGKANAERSAFRVPGIQSFDDGGIRGRRAK